MQTFSELISSGLMAAMVSYSFVDGLSLFGKKQQKVKPPLPTKGFIDSPANVKISIAEYCELYGYDSEHHSVVTEDGILSKNPLTKGTKGPLILVHGLLQNSGVYISSGINSFAFLFAEAGYDVFLANNRCIGDHNHIKLKPHEAKYWDWCLDDLAKYDFPAFIDYALKITNSKKCIYVGHSQGTSQAFLGLHFNPLLSNKIKCYVALAPALYVGPILSEQPFKTIINESDSTFWLLFGRKSFVPLMHIFKRSVSIQLYTTISYQMFNYLFGWTDRSWLPEQKCAHFHFTLSHVSTKLLLHWFKITRSGGYVMPYALDRCCGLPRCIKPLLYNHQLSPTISEQQIIVNNDSNIEQNGESTTIPSFDLSCIQCPLAIIYGENDKIIDGDRLVRELQSNPKVDTIYIDKIKDYEHLDLIWASDSKQKVFNKVATLLESLPVV